MHSWLRLGDKQFQNIFCEAFDDFSRDYCRSSIFLTLSHGTTGKRFLFLNIDRAIPSPTRSSVSRPVASTAV